MPDRIYLLPRSLAMKMLHEAQVAGAEGIAGIIVGEGVVGEGVVGEGMPVSFRAASYSASDETLLALADRNGQSVWGLFRYRPGDERAPDAVQLKSYPDLLFFGADLAIRGVLQLRAWKLLDDAVVVCPVAIQG